MTPQPPAAPDWERSVLEKVALQAIREQRRSRQWSALFKLLWFLFAFLVLAALLGWIGRPDKDAAAMSAGRHTALVELEGVIAPESKASAEHVIKGLNRAFKDANTVGVVLRINSPGGSPVQAGYMNDEIRRLRAKYPDIPLHVVVQDLCASGGYYVAVAADRIYVDKASLVGSIGVIMGGFGFTGAMDKLGIERRAYTAGDNKDFLDPFVPENPRHRAHAQKMLSTLLPILAMTAVTMVKAHKPPKLSSTASVAPPSVCSARLMAPSSKAVARPLAMPARVENNASRQNGRKSRNASLTTLRDGASFIPDSLGP